MTKYEKWGFLRENTSKAKKAGIDKITGLHRTGLNEYLSVIFPNTNDWINDKRTNIIINNKRLLNRPDYRSESLNMIIEFDGIQHFTKPNIIKRDVETTSIYTLNGYKVVRIPYFIQLTNKAIETLFGVVINEPMFNPNIASLGPEDGSPAFLCSAGLKRMVEVFKHFPEQYILNLNYLKSFNNDFLTGATLLEREMTKSIGQQSLNLAITKDDCHSEQAPYHPKFPR